MIDPIPSEPFLLTFPGEEPYEVTDPEQARADIASLVAGVMDIRPAEAGQALASAKLHTIWIRTRSVGYTRWMAEQTMQIVALEMLHTAETWELASRLRHVNNLILAWRVIRPVSYDLDATTDATGTEPS